MRRETHFLIIFLDSKDERSLRLVRSKIFSSEESAKESRALLLLRLSIRFRSEKGGIIRELAGANEYRASRFRLLARESLADSTTVGRFDVEVKVKCGLCRGRVEVASRSRRCPLVTDRCR